MKLDATDLRYVTPEEFRVLTAVRSCRALFQTGVKLRDLLGRDGVEKP